MSRIPTVFGCALEAWGWVGCKSDAMCGVWSDAHFAHFGISIIIMSSKTHHYDTLLHAELIAMVCFAPSKSVHVGYKTVPKSTGLLRE